MPTMRAPQARRMERTPKVMADDGSDEPSPCVLAAAKFDVPLWQSLSLRRADLLANVVALRVGRIEGRCKRVTMYTMSCFDNVGKAGMIGRIVRIRLSQDSLV